MFDKSLNSNLIQNENQFFNNVSQREQKKDMISEKEWTELLQNAFNETAFATENLMQFVEDYLQISREGLVSLLQDSLKAEEASIEEGFVSLENSLEKEDVSLEERIDSLETSLKEEEAMVKQLLEEINTLKEQVASKEETDLVDELIASLKDSFKEEVASAKKWIEILKNSAISVAVTPLHLSKIQKLLGQANLYRVLLTFSRLTLTSSLNLLQDQIVDPSYQEAIQNITTSFDLLKNQVDPSHQEVIQRITENLALLKNDVELNQQAAAIQNITANLEPLKNQVDQAAFQNITENLELLKNQVEHKAAIQNINADLNAPKDAMNYFSVGLPLVRLSLDAMQLIRHTFFPKEELNSKTTFERFKSDFRKRRNDIASNGAWAAVNYICNFKIPNDIKILEESKKTIEASQLAGTMTPEAAEGPLKQLNEQIANLNNIALVLTVACLGFDILLLCCAKHMEKQDHIMKQAEISQKLEDYRDLNKFTKLSKEQRDAEIEKLEKEHEEQEIAWRTKEAKFDFESISLAVTALGLTLAPSTAGLGFLISMIGMAMALSESEYVAYKDKNIRLEHVNLDNLEEVQEERNAAFSDFLLALLKNAAIPTALFATFALNPALGMMLSVSYLGYKVVSHEHNKYNNQNKVANVAEVEEEKPQLAYARR